MSRWNPLDNMRAPMPLEPPDWATLPEPGGSRRPKTSMGQGKTG